MGSRLKKGMSLVTSCLPHHLANFMSTGSGPGWGWECTCSIVASSGCCQLGLGHIPSAPLGWFKADAGVGISQPMWPIPGICNTGARMVPWLAALSLFKLDPWFLLVTLLPSTLLWPRVSSPRRLWGLAHCSGPPLLACELGQLLLFLPLHLHPYHCSQGLFGALMLPQPHPTWGRAPSTVQTIVSLKSRHG